MDLFTQVLIIEGWSCGYQASGVYSKQRVARQVGLEGVVLAQMGWHDLDEEGNPLKEAYLFTFIRDSEDTELCVVPQRVLVWLMTGSESLKGVQQGSVQDSDKLTLF